MAFLDFELKERSCRRAHISPNQVPSPRFSPHPQNSGFGRESERGNVLTPNNG